jgi:hypothetical protein
MSQSRWRLQKNFRALQRLKLHELLALAIEALKEAEQPGALVKPHMSAFHKYVEKTDLCLACLGGLAVIKALDLDMTQPEYRKVQGLGCFSYPVSKKLGLTYDWVKDKLRNAECALDDLRQGHLANAYRQLFGEQVIDHEKLDYLSICEFSVPEYSEAPEKFHQKLAEIHQLLKSVDL